VGQYRAQRASVSVNDWLTLDLSTLSSSEPTRAVFQFTTIASRSAIRRSVQF